VLWSFIFEGERIERERVGKREFSVKEGSGARLNVGNRGFPSQFDSKASPYPHKINPLICL
jgi:hypothetical protein